MVTEVEAEMSKFCSSAISKKPNGPSKFFT